MFILFSIRLFALLECFCESCVCALLLFDCVLMTESLLVCVIVLLCTCVLLGLLLVVCVLLIVVHCVFVLIVVIVCFVFQEIQHCCYGFLHYGS